MTFSFREKGIIKAIDKITDLLNHYDRKTTDDIETDFYILLDILLLQSDNYDTILNFMPEYIEQDEDAKIKQFVIKNGDYVIVSESKMIMPVDWKSSIKKMEFIELDLLLSALSNIEKRIL